MWMKKNKWRLTIPAFVIAVLAASFYFGGNAPALRGWSTNATSLSSESNEAETAWPAAAPDDDPAQTQPIDSAAAEETPKADSVEPNEAVPLSEPTTPPVETQTQTISPQTPPVSSPNPTEPEAKELTCTVSISCETILKHMELCDPEKLELVPENGQILAPLTVTFHPGESVFDVLKRVCRENNIHLEFSQSPAYGSVYIEGIWNLYEFDVGELSGWMYQVNGWFPNYGCSLYAIEDADEICWVYTCDQGGDVGGGIG